MTPLMQYKDIPAIDAAEVITAFNMHKLIPTGFDDQVEVLWEDGAIVLKCLKAENSFIDSVTIPPVLFNFVDYAEVPVGFIFTESSERQCDYFGADSNLVLNLRQVLYYVIQNRLAIWSQYDHQFVGLLASDIKNLRSFVEYGYTSASNASIKKRNAFVVINHPEKFHESAIGERIHNTVLTEADWSAFYRDQPLDVSSETAMASSNKITILTSGEQFKATGYTKGKDEQGDYVISIFPPKQNVPARWKTHILGNALPLRYPDTPCFTSNIVSFTKPDGTLGYKPIDACRKAAVIVFDHMEKDSQRFVAGELEASLNLGDTLVHLNKKVSVDFLDPDEPLRVNDFYQPNFERFKIGLDEDREPIYIYDVKELTVVDIIPSGSNGVTEIKLDMVIKAGNARIISDSALKGVTKTKPKLGYLTMVNPKVDVTKLAVTPSTARLLKDNNYEEFDPLDPRMMTVPVDIIAGMNAIKAKDNTIALAQAAFAVKYGFYKPSTKMGFEGLLNDKNEAEINAAAQSLPAFTFTDEFGNQRKVKFGLVYAMYTELGEVYSKFKKQSFPFEAGKNINQNMPKLYTHIWENYLEKDRVALALELSKCLYDTKGKLNNVESETTLPVYSVKKIRSLFKFEDLVLSQSLLFKSGTKLLDPDFNKGFYINLGVSKSPRIRIPSADSLNQLVGELKSGEITYHAIIVNICKIISNLLGNEANGHMPSIPFIYDPKGKRFTSHVQYMKSLQGAIFSSDEASEMKIQCLIKPMIYGVNMKQVVEHRLPFNTLVIMDDKIYRKFCDIAAGETYPDQIFRKIGDNPTFIDFLNQHCPNIYATHSPHLWTTQSFAPIIWDRHTYALYLKQEHNINLDDYLYTRSNNDIVLIHPMLALQAKKDVDGDLICLMAFNDKGQEMLQNFELPNVVQKELDWINAYVEGEYEGTFDLDLDAVSVYKLHKLYLCENNPCGENHVKNYAQYILNASIAKKNIGQ